MNHDARAYSDAYAGYVPQTSADNGLDMNSICVAVVANPENVRKRFATPGGPLGIF